MTKWLCMAAFAVSAFLVIDTSALAQGGDGCLSVSGCSGSPGPGGGDPTGDGNYTPDPNQFTWDDPWDFWDCEESAFYCPHREQICQAQCEQNYENAALQCSRIQSNWERNECFDSAGVNLYVCRGGCH
jgi:hypothetical protein